MRKSVIPTLMALVCTSYGFTATINVPNDYVSIQDAIEAAQNGDSILVDAGTYIEHIDYLGKAITIVSVSGSLDTIIDGSGSGSVVTFENGEQATSVLDGFTIRAGSNLYGGGLSILNAFPNIQNCHFTGNQSTFSGGAMYVKNGAVQLDNVVFEGNSAGGAGGAIYLNGSSATIVGGSMRSNEANNGGALYVKDSSSELSVTNIIFSDNEAFVGGGAVFNKNSTLNFSACTFESNDSIDGGAWFSYSGGNATISNSVFMNNSAENLGGAANIRSNSSVSFISCTFDSNVADSDCDTNGGGAILNIASSIVTLDSPTICNNVLCDVDDLYYGDEPSIIGDIVDCTPTDGPGACCGGTACWNMEEIDCDNGGGLWNGSGSICAEIVCEGGGGTITGACCVESYCVHAAEASCVLAGGVFYGTTETCGTTSCPVNCSEDINGDGVIDVEDLLLLISAWGVCP